MKLKITMIINMERIQILRWVKNMSMIKKSILEGADTISKYQNRVKYQHHVLHVKLHAVPYYDHKKEC